MSFRRRLLEEMQRVRTTADLYEVPDRGLMCGNSRPTLRVQRRPSRVAGSRRHKTTCRSRTWRTFRSIFPAQGVERPPESTAGELRRACPILRERAVGWQVPKRPAMHSGCWPVGASESTSLRPEYLNCLVSPRFRDRHLWFGTKPCQIEGRVVSLNPIP
jgi:hypothetical protein